MTNCDSCGYEWQYSGDLLNATCPNCGGKTSVTDEPGECVICGTEDSLRWHHVSYDPEEVVVLCQEHHVAVHKDRTHSLYPVDDRPGTNINEAFTAEEMQALRSVKGARTWREAILSEFGVETETEVVEA